MSHFKAPIRCVTEISFSANKTSGRNNLDGPWRAPCKRLPSRLRECECSLFCDIRSLVGCQRNYAGESSQPGRNYSVPGGGRQRGWERETREQRTRERGVLFSSTFHAVSPLISSVNCCRSSNKCYIQCCVNSYFYRLAVQVPQQFLHHWNHFFPIYNSLFHQR